MAVIRHAVVLAAVMALAPATAVAHGGPDLLGQSLRLADGLVEVALETGPPLLTHGGDAFPGEPTGGGTGIQRPPLCAKGHRQQVLYGRPLSAPDRLAASEPVISAAIFNMNAELDRAARESGGVHADYRVACDAGGRLSVTGFVNLGTASFGDVVDAARLSGAIDPTTNYTIFYDDPSPKACGIGSIQSDEQPGAENRNNAGGAYAVIYRDCWDGVTAMHETGHNLGAVQTGAPNSTGLHGHCRDESDVMCYADGAEGPTGMIDSCAGGERFDCGYDDYFDAAPEAGEYLAGHWNIGSRANRFIVFADLLPGEAAVAGECATDADPARALAVDVLGCPPEVPVADEVEEEEEEVEEPSVRIVRVVHHRRKARVQVRLQCPASRGSACHGRVLLTRKVTRGAGGRSFRLSPGTASSVRIPLARAAQRAWTAGRLSRVWVVARAGDATADAARALRLRTRAKGA